MRALGILAGALTAAEAASPMLPSGFVRWLLLAVIFVLGGVLFAVIQYAPAAYYQGNGRWQDWLRRVRRHFWQWRSSARAFL